MRKKIPLDESYIASASIIAKEIVEAIEREITNTFSNCTKETVFREMWETTCCGKLLNFEAQWEVSTFPIHRKDVSWPWSSSEKALYDLFLRIFHTNSEDITTDITYALSRWSPETSEGIVIRSWLESPFYL